MSFQLTRHVTLPRVPHTNIRYLGIEIYVFVFLLNITIFEGYLVLNVGKLGSYISFLVKPPTSFILYCVFPSIWGLYTVTLSPRIASPIQTKHKKIKNDTHCFTTQNQTLYMFDPNAKEFSRFQKKMLIVHNWGGRGRLKP